MNGNWEGTRSQMQSRRDECRPEYGGVQCIMHRYRKTC